MRAHLIMAVMSLSVIVGTELQGQSLRFAVARTSSGVDWIYPPAPADSDGYYFVRGSSNTDRSGLAVSLSIRKSLAPWFALESGLQAVAKGFQVTGPTFHMTYAEVPLVGILQTGRDAGVFVEGGAIIGLRVRCRRFMDTVDGFHEDGCGAEATSYDRALAPLRRSDLSWTLGFGARLALGAGRLVFNVRSQRSLVDIQPAGSNGKMVNRVHMLALGYEVDVW